MAGLTDFLQAFAKGFVPRAGDIFGQLSQQAIGGPQGYAQSQENARQAAQLAQQLQIHNSMTPYESATVARNKTQDASAEAQRQFQDLFQMNSGVAQGLFKPADADDTGAIQPPGAAQSYNPIVKTTHTIAADSDLGKDIGLKDDLKNLSSEDLLRYLTPYAEKKEAAVQKAKEEADLRDNLNVQKDAMKKQIEARFAPSYYQPLYGEADPSAADHKATKLAQLETAFTEDQRNKVSSRMTAFPKELDSFTSPWEKQKLAEKNRADAADNAKAGKDFGQNVIDPATGLLTRVYPGQKVPKGAVTMAGENTMNTPTAAMRARGEMAQTVSAQVPNLTAQVDNLASKIGPGAGRWNETWVNKGGMNDPDFAGLDQDLKMYASGIVVTHFGQRGGQQVREALEKNFGEAQSPEDLKSRIQHADSWLQGYAKAARITIPDPATVNLNLAGPPSAAATTPPKKLDLSKFERK